MIKIKNLTHTYEKRDEEAVRDINLHIKKGESVVILGSSGSGKSTLFRCITRLIEPSSGAILINDEDILNCSLKKAVNLRGKIGMIFQNFNLLEGETVLTNVLNGRLKYNNFLNALIGKFSKKDYVVARKNLKKVGLEEYEDEVASKLSGGQKQRVAIARALSQEPEIILADEPVSNLDPRLMGEIMDLLKKICDEEGITLVTNLHFLEFAKKYGSRLIGMKDGAIVFDGKPKELTKKRMIDIYGKT